MENAVPNDERRYKMAIMYKVFFLPILSAGNPPNKEPITVPIKAIEIVNPC